MPAKPKTVESYLDSIPPKQRAALEKLRNTIRKVVPQAEECISYGIPAFRLNGFLVGYAAGKKHCSFYPGAVITALKGELKDFDLSKGTIRFQPEKPIPMPLVKKLVMLSVERNLVKSKKSK